MTTTATKVNTKWDSKKTAQVTSHIVAAQWLASWQVISKLDEKTQQQWHDAIRQQKLNHYKSMNIKTPLELVTAIAETEHNVYGSEIEVSGDANKATLKYNSCGMWEASKTMCEGKFTPEQEQKMGENCQASWNHIAKEFGFTFVPKMEKDSYEMTFSK